MSAEPKSTLYGKLAAVTAEVGYVAKDGRNEFQNYKYTSAEALLATVRGPLSARNVVLMPSVTALSEREYTTSKGKASVITTVHVAFTLVDGDSGEQHRCEWAGQGDDPADKGLGKAYTNAIKTFLREQFLIPQGDDPEADSTTDRRAGDRVTTPQSNGQQVKATPKTAVPLKVTAEDAQEIKAACEGLSREQVRLAFGAVGLDAMPFSAIPREKAAGLVAKLAEARR